MKKTFDFEVSISNVYEAETPEQAVKMFLANIPTADWFVTVKNIKTTEKFLVDTEDYSTEPTY